MLGLSAILLHQLRLLACQPGWGGSSWRRPALQSLLLLAGLLCLLPSGRTCRSNRMTAVQFDVGQGDCALLTFPDGWRILIDTGPGWSGGTSWERTVKPWLVREGIRHLDAVALTHAHADHTAGAAAIARNLPVRRWWLGGSAVAPAGQTVSQQPRPNEVLHQAGPWSLVCLNPEFLPATKLELTENDSSLLLGLLYRDRLLALWSGDSEERGEALWLAATDLPPVSPHCVWKAGHHGSATSGSPPLLAYLRPDVVLISCGIENRHGHPSHGPYHVDHDTATVWRTDLHGSILLQWSPAGELRRLQPVRSFRPAGTPATNGGDFPSTVAPNADPHPPVRSRRSPT
jgi:competence protein ComEC